MAERVYTTDGIILRRRSTGEANILVSILTKDLGLIEAAARSVRAERSKLRFSLSSLSHGSFSLVAGEHTFRIIGAHSDGVFAKGGSREAVQTLGKLAALLLRLMPRAESSPALYAFVKESFTLIERQGEGRRREALEGVLLLRVLHELGYVSQAQELAPFLSAPLPVEGLIDAFLLVRTQAIAAINRALAASGL